MKHPETDLDIFEPKEIKSASLEYCVNLLTKKHFMKSTKMTFIFKIGSTYLDVRKRKMMSTMSFNLKILITE